MSSFLYHLFSSTTLISLGLYHLISSTKSHFKSPNYTSKPFHFFQSTNPHLKNLPLYLTILSLFISFLHQTLISAIPDPLLKGSSAVHLFSSLQSSAVLFLFLLLSVSLLIPSSLLPLPNDVVFASASAAFFLQSFTSSSSASVQLSDLQAQCDLISSKISALSSLLALVLAFNPRVFIADVGLSASVILQGLWVLQTGLSLYVEAFIPEGCHRLLDVARGVEGSTKCDLEDSRFRAVAILDLVFVVHVMFVMVIVMVVYGVVGRSAGSGGSGGASGVRKLGSYEALPTSSADGNGNGSSINSSHIQMKALTGTQA